MFSLFVGQFNAQIVLPQASTIASKQGGDERLEPTFQEKYSQVAWSGKHSEYTVTRFIFQNLVLLKICSFLGYTSSLTPNIA